MVNQSDVYLTTQGAKNTGMGKTVEELRLADWREVVVVGRLRGGGFVGGGKGGVGGGRWCRRRCRRAGHCW